MHNTFSIGTQIENIHKQDGIRHNLSTNTYILNIIPSSQRVHKCMNTKRNPKLEADSESSLNNFLVTAY